MKYYISFDTKTIPKTIKAISIEIKEEIVIDEKKAFQINLIDDRLYKHLEQYVIMNMKPNNTDKIN